jgi:hypothetical protein
MVRGCKRGAAALQDARLQGGDVDLGGLHKCVWGVAGWDSEAGPSVHAHDGWEGT